MSRQSSVFQVLIAGGIVGLAMFAFSHIFEAPIQAQSELKLDVVQAITVPVTDVSVVSVAPDYDVPPDAIVQSWLPETLLGDGPFPPLDFLDQHLTAVGLSGVIPPPGLAFIFPASFSRLSPFTIQNQILKATNGIIFLGSTTYGGIL